MTNAELEKMVDTTAEWIVTRTGIHTRRVVAPDQASSDLAIPASEAALRDAGLSAADLDLIICATTTPDMVFPATACLVQNSIGAKRAGAFDLLAACSSFVYGVISAAQAIETGIARHVLVVGAEVLTRLVDWTDRTTCVLIGDGAGAVVMGPARNGGGVRASVVGADGSASDILNLPSPGSRIPASAEAIAKGLHRARMDGQSVFKLAVRTVPGAIHEVVLKAGMTLDDIAWVVPHQANQRIIEAIARGVDVPLERFISTIDHYGNTSSASIPLSLWEARSDGRLKDGDHIVLVAFGGGFTWAAVVLTWGP
ncbi:MAG: 3-oxoacyl-ACP synthase [Armatimonadetes bacterium RBG_16_67_12]|nr:MAG: 3-oxoacyl-ACP synthase [Armatimonadetes bacterium RBG_16_67_12]